MSALRQVDRNFSTNARQSKVVDALEWLTELCNDLIGGVGKDKDISWGQRARGGLQ